MNPLQSRKQLLIAESDLNRALLAGDLATLKADVRALSDRAQSISSIASSAAMLVTGLAALTRGKAADSGGKRSWWHRILKGVGLISTIWLAFRSQRHHLDRG